MHACAVCLYTPPAQAGSSPACLPHLPLLCPLFPVTILPLCPTHVPHHIPPPSLWPSFPHPYWDRFSCWVPSSCLLLYAPFLHVHSGLGTEQVGCPHTHTTVQLHTVLPSYFHTHTCSITHTFTHTCITRRPHRRMIPTLLLGYTHTRSSFTLYTHYRSCRLFTFLFPLVLGWFL